MATERTYRYQFILESAWSGRFVYYAVGTSKTDAMTKINLDFPFRVLSGIRVKRGLSK